MKVSELTGAELDYWVAKAQGENPCIEDEKCMISWNAGELGGNETHRAYFQPSVDWNQGGPIIEREKINIDYRARQKKWFAMIELKASLPREWGETCLIAAMRAFVSSHFGEEVPSE